MCLFDRIRRALVHKKKIVPEDKSKIMKPEKKLVAELKEKLLQLHKETTKQGKRVESLTVIHDTRSPSRSVFEFTTSKLQDPPKKQETNYNKKQVNYCKPITLVGGSDGYDEKSVCVHEYQPGVKVSLVVRTDGARDIVRLTYSGGMSMPERAIWSLENKEKVCKRLNITATPPPEAPLISIKLSWVSP